MHYNGFDIRFECGALFTFDTVLAVISAAVEPILSMLGYFMQSQSNFNLIWLQYIAETAAILFVVQRTAQTKPSHPSIFYCHFVYWYYQWTDFFLVLISIYLEINEIKIDELFVLHSIGPIFGGGSGRRIQVHNSIKIKRTHYVVRCSIK